MADGPTTINGPLHTDEANLADRQIIAYFESVQEADSVQQALLKADVVAAQIKISNVPAGSANLEPADNTLVGKIREAVLPDDSQRATRDAMANGDVMLSVSPGEGNVDQIIAIIQAGKPHHFDAALERWRNSSPA